MGGKEDEEDEKCGRGRQKVLSLICDAPAVENEFEWGPWRLKIGRDESDIKVRRTTPDSVNAAQFAAKLTFRQTPFPTPAIPVRMGGIRRETWGRHVRLVLFGRLRQIFSLAD